MVIISIIGIVCILVLLYMYKEGHENNIRSHEVKATGDSETINLFLYRIHMCAKLMRQ